MTGTRALAALLSAFARRWPWRLAGGVALVAAALAAGAGLLAASGSLIAGSALAGLGLIVFDTFRPSAIVRLLAIVRTAARYAERLSTHDATLRFLADLRVDVFRGLLARPRGGERPALLFNRLAGDLSALDGLPIRFAVPVAAATLTLAGTALALSAVSWTLAAAATLPVAIGGVVAPVLLAGRGSRAARRKQYALDAARVRLVDLDRGRAALGAGGGLAEAAAGVLDAFQRAAAAERATWILDLAVRIAAGLGHQGAVLATLAVGAGLHRDGALSGPAFAGVVLFSLALGEAVAPLRALALEYGRWTLAARRIAPLAAPVAPASPIASEGSAGAVARLAGVAVREPGAAVARLEGVDLVVAPGRRIALVGPSGGGKSTLIGLLAGTVAATAGSVRRAPGLVVVGLGQRTELFRGTVADNLRLAAPDAGDGALAAMVEAVGLGPALGPDGLARRLGDGGSGLSGGERRRLAIARTLLSDADLYLLDEPTEGLDAAAAARVFDLVLERTAGRTLVFATHRPAEAARADVVVEIRDGRLAAAVPAAQWRGAVDA